MFYFLLMLKKMVILTVHTFRMKPLLKIWEIIHMNHIYHKFITGGNIIQVKRGYNFRNIVTTGL